MLSTQPEMKPTPTRRLHRIKDFSGAIEIRGRKAVLVILPGMIVCFFDLPLRTAARVLHVCPTLLKGLRCEAGEDVWPCRKVVLGTFRMSRDEIASVRRSFIEQLEQDRAGGKYVSMLPVLREAEQLGLVYRSIDEPTAYMRQLRILANDKAAAQAAGGAWAVAEVFQRPVIVQGQQWVSAGLSDAVVKVDDPRQSFKSPPAAKADDPRPSFESPPAAAAKADDFRQRFKSHVTAKADDFRAALEMSEPKGFRSHVAAKADASEPKGSRQPICPLAYAKECSTPSYVQACFPSPSDAAGVFWPVPAMVDPARLWLQEAVYRSLVPTRRGPRIAVRDLVASVRLSAAEVLFADSLMADG